MRSGSATCPEIFHLAPDNGKNSVIEEYEIHHEGDRSIGIIPGELYDCAERSAESCPVEAIIVEQIEE
jgi:ferredoxin